MAPKRTATCWKRQENYLFLSTSYSSSFGCCQGWRKPTSDWNICNFQGSFAPFWGARCFIGHLHYLWFIQFIQTRECAVLPLFMGFLGYFIHGAQGNTRWAPQTAYGGRTPVPLGLLLRNRLMPGLCPRTRLSRLPDTAKHPKITTIKNSQSPPKHLELAIWQLSRKKPFLTVQISNTHCR